MTATPTAGQLAGTDSLATLTAQADPAHQTQYHIVLLDHVINDGLVTSDTLATTPANRYGNDYIAGGAGNDEVFGQLGDDVIQGDGGIEDAFAGNSHAGASRSPDGANGTVVDLVGDLDIVPSFEASATDGQDYIEGNGGNDIVFGGLNQDDIVGGSSDFFSLTTPNNRPDGADLLFGGAGTDIARSHIGDATEDGNNVITTTPTGHASDADTIVGDNGRIIRIVGTNGVDINPTGNPASPLYVSFNYDNYGPTKIVVRGVTLIDYTPGGPDFNPALPPASGLGGDIFGADEVHGESGDDTVYLGAGNDVAYGDGQDDDLVGGWGDDWISGGTGSDGILGDDGRIFTSRNSRSADPANPGYLVSDGEPLFGILPLLSTDPDPQHPRIIHGNVLNEFVYTPGQVQTATLNLSGALNKAFDITPFDWKPNSLGADDPLFDANFADDVIYGGLGDDLLHGAVGDDAISGAEALTQSYTQYFNFNTGQLLGIALSDWTRPFNTGDMLVFGNDDDSWHANKPSRPGEFALYDEFDPRRVISLNADGTKSTTGPNGYNWFLNFASNEGTFFPGGVTDKSVVYPATRNDGRDLVFGDHGNDWLVGGTGRDDHWGGWGTDLLNADDLLGSTNGQTPANPPGSGTSDEAPDTSPNYEDRAYAGASYDILIGNTGGDRLIDWVGEFNSYIVPFAPFGIDAVSRQRPPQLDEFLYALSRADGADPTRWHDTTSDPSFLPRNGEPYGELGLITQKDHGLWQDQTGGPTDPQPGNIPGGRRDVLNSADFNAGNMSSFRADSGVFEVQNGSLRVAAASLGKDAAAVFYMDQYLPVYYELAASVMVQKPTGGWKANAYIIFDYQSPTDFKFAGIDVSINKIVMGHRNAQGWIVDVQSSVQGGVKADTFYQMLVAVNGTYVTVQVNGLAAFSWNFPARVIDGDSYGLNKGMVGMGSDNSRGVFDNIAVQVLPPQLTLDHTEDFNDGVANLFTGNQEGTWTVASGRFNGTAATPGASGWKLVDLGLANGLEPSSYLELQTRLRTDAIGGIVFDRYGATDYKFVAIDVVADKVLIGHVDPRRGWVIDGSFTRTLDPGVDYTLWLTMRGASMTVTLNGGLVASWGFNGIVVDGKFGLITRGGTSSFDEARIRTNDPAFAGAVPMFADVAPAKPAAGSVVNEQQLAVVVKEGVRRWLAAGESAEELAGVRVAIADLPDLYLGQTHDKMIYIDADAAGYGWFIDTTPWDDAEFTSRIASAELKASDLGAPFERMDLLTLVMHELGHVLGHENVDVASHPQDLMAESLVVGVRRLPVGLAPILTTAEMTAQVAATVAPPTFGGAIVFNPVPFASGIVQDRVLPNDRRRSVEVANGVAAAPAIANDLLIHPETVPVLPWFLPDNTAEIASVHILEESSDVENGRHRVAANVLLWGEDAAKRAGLPALTDVALKHDLNEPGPDAANDAPAALWLFLEDED